jgi:hypothetical protein
VAYICLASLLREEGNYFGARKEIQVCHPGEEGEDFCVVLLECGFLHVVKYADVPKDLLDPLRRPSMGWKMLDADPGMALPASLAGVGLEPPRLDQEDDHSDEHRTSS